jgi:hypothetical protein
MSSWGRQAVFWDTSLSSIVSLRLPDPDRCCAYGCAPFVVAARHNAQEPGGGDCAARFPFPPFQRLLHLDHRCADGERGLEGALLVSPLLRSPTPTGGMHSLRRNHSGSGVGAHLC